MLQDDYGNAIDQDEYFREHALADASDLIDSVGLRAFLVYVQSKVENQTEYDNIKHILKEW